MSGGSYNYLWRHGDLEQRRSDIEAMAARLEKAGYDAPARATRDVLVLLDAARQAAAGLADVWHAVEWADSGDWGEDDVREAVEKFGPWPPPADGEGNQS